jgi:hypothetical protein
VIVLALVALALPAVSQATGIPLLSGPEGANPENTNTDLFYGGVRDRRDRGAGIRERFLEQMKEGSSEAMRLPSPLQAASCTSAPVGGRLPHDSEHDARDEHSEHHDG